MLLKPTANFISFHQTFNILNNEILKNMALRWSVISWNSDDLIYYLKSYQAVIQRKKKNNHVELECEQKNKNKNGITNVKKA